MSDRLRVLIDERATTAAAMRTIVDKAELEKRAPTSEESAKHEELFGKTEELRAQIETLQRQDRLDKEMAERQAQLERDKRSGDKSGEKPELRAFRRYLAGGANALSSDELRALQADVGTSGGALVMPQELVNALIKNVDDMVFIRQRATKFAMPKADSIGVPTLAADPDDADWTSELATGNEDSAMAFGKREMRPHPLAKRIKISKKLIAAASQDPVALVQSRLAYKFGIAQEKGYLTGTGTRQPLGLFTASADGIPTSRDFGNGTGENTTTTIAMDGLIASKYALKAQYWANAAWLFHRDAMKQISKLKDGDGQYLWMPSVREGEPDRLLGFPILMSEYAPSTFSSAQYIGLVGDFSYYWIVDALDLTIQRLVELYAETNQDGFIGRMETDGAPVLAEAFARVKLAT